MGDRVSFLSKRRTIMASSEISKVHWRHFADGRRIWAISKQQTHSRLVAFILQTYVTLRAKCINKQALIQPEEDSAVKRFFLFDGYCLDKSGHSTFRRLALVRPSCNQLCTLNHLLLPRFIASRCPLTRQKTGGRLHRHVQTTGRIRNISLTFIARHFIWAQITVLMCKNR